MDWANRRYPNSAPPERSPAATARFLAALFLFCPATTWAQPEPPESSSSAVSISPTSPAVARSEALFHQGETALNAGDVANARAAFDAALDAFIAQDQNSPISAESLAAYRGLVLRIHAAEVGGTARPRSASFVEPPSNRTSDPSQPPARPAEEADTQPEGSLAELGDRIEAIQPTDEERRSTAAVLVTEAIDLPIELNDQVLGAIDLYSGKFNKWFSQALSRGAPHLPRIREILAAAGIPQDLAYVPIVESAFNPSALSRAKARGLWQFIPSTGKQYGLKQDFYIDERADIEKATVAAAQYLKNLYAMFGDWNLALAGYNAGEGSVQRAIRRGQTSDFWALAKTKSFRAETKNYVPLIHAAIVIAKSPVLWKYE